MCSGYGVPPVRRSPRRAWGWGVAWDAGLPHKTLLEPPNAGTAEPFRVSPPEAVAYPLELVPPFETAFQAHLAVWRLEGKPRTARRFTVYKNCPLPTPEDRLLFILVYLKTLRTPGGARALIRHGPGQSQSVDPCPVAGVARGAAHPRRCPGPLPLGPGPAPRYCRG